MSIGRNDPCQCGFGKKYKKCCLLKGNLKNDLSVNNSQQRESQKQAITINSLLEFSEEDLFSRLVNPSQKQNDISWIKKHLIDFDLSYSNGSGGFYLQLSLFKSIGFIGVGLNGDLFYHDGEALDFQKVLILFYYILKKDQTLFDFSKNIKLEFHVNTIQNYFSKTHKIKLEAIALSDINLDFSDESPNLLLNEIIKIKKKKNQFLNKDDNLRFFSQMDGENGDYFFDLGHRITGPRYYFGRNEGISSPLENIRYIFSDGEVISLHQLIFHPYIIFLDDEYIPLIKRAKINNEISYMSWPEGQSDYSFSYGDEIKKDETILLDLFYNISKTSQNNKIKILMSKNPSQKYIEHIYNEVDEMKFYKPSHFSIEVAPNLDLLEPNFEIIISCSDKDIPFDRISNRSVSLCSQNRLYFHQMNKFTKILNSYLYPINIHTKENKLYIYSEMSDMLFGQCVMMAKECFYDTFGLDMTIPTSHIIPDDQVKLILHLENNDDIIRMKQLTWGSDLVQDSNFDHSFSSYPKELNFLFESLEWGISSFFQKEGKDIAIKQQGYERQNDLKILRHSGIFLFLMNELIRSYEQYSKENKTRKNKMIDSIYQKVSAVFHSFITKEEINNDRIYDLQDLCSKKVSRLIKKALSQIMEHLKGEENHIFSDSKIYNLNTGVFMRKFSASFCEYLIDPKDKKQFLRTKLKKYSYDFESIDGDEFLTVKFPRMQEWAFRLEANFTDVYLDDIKIERCEEDDFKFEYHLDENETKIDWFELHPKIFFQGEEVSSNDIGSFSTNRVIPFKGKFYVLDKNEIPGFKWLDYFWENLTALKSKNAVNEKNKSYIEEVPKSQVLNILALRKAGADIRGGETWEEIYREFDKLINRDQSFISKKNRYPSIPKKLDIPLKDYQKVGVQWLMDLYNIQLGGILADDMGLGKTIQTLAFLDILRSKKELKKTMIIVPTSLVYNWAEEVKKFTPKLEIERFNTQKIELFEEEWAEAQDQNKVLLVTYGQLYTRGELLSSIDWNICIFDESQNIKNITSKRTSAARLLKAKCKFCLTGTPMENHFGEFFSMIDLVVPGALGKYQEFMKTYSFKSSSGAISDKAVSAQDIEFLKLKTAPLVLRRMKSQILNELPEKTETILHLEFDKEQRKIYKNIAISWNDKIQTMIEEKGSSHGQLEKLTALLRLRQACSVPSVIPNVEYKLSAPKMIQLLSMIRELFDKGESVLVFTNFVSTLEALKSHCEEDNIPCFAITGKVNAKKREGILKSFNEGESASVLFMTLKTGGVGLNLTRASYVFHIEPWWNPASENQATDRAYRMGQTKNVQVYRFIMTDSVEEKIQTLKGHKSAAFNSLFLEQEDDDFSEKELGTLSFSKKGLDQKDFEYLLS